MSKKISDEGQEIIDKINTYIKSHDIFWSHDLIKFLDIENQYKCFVVSRYLKQLYKANKINPCDAKSNHKQYIVVDIEWSKAL